MSRGRNCSSVYCQDYLKYCVRYVMENHKQARDRRFATPQTSDGKPCSVDEHLLHREDLDFFEDKIEKGYDAKPSFCEAMSS